MEREVSAVLRVFIPRTAFSVEKKPVLIDLGTVLPRRASVTRVLRCRRLPRGALGGSRVQVICVQVTGAGGLRDAHRIVAARRLRRPGRPRGSASLRGCRPGDTAHEVPGRRQGHRGRPLGGFKRPDPRCLLPAGTPAKSASQGGGAVSAEPEAAADR